jgi:hypothetical protein
MGMQQQERQKQQYQREQLASQPQSGVNAITSGSHPIT